MNWLTLSEFEMITRALYTDSSNQSLWFYYEWLVLVYANLATIRESILPDLSISQRKDRLTKELDMLADMLDGDEDCKQIYEALVQLTIILSQLQNQQKASGLSEERPQSSEVGRGVWSWLEKLRQLDSLRRGRWDDMESKLRQLAI
jgi:geranylgeranyl transferase type-2 subunit alpha